MSTILAKLKSSLALDRARDRASAQPDLGNSFASLARHLQEARPTAAVPEDLHSFIMRAVRVAGKESLDPRQFFLGRWVAAGGAALLLALVVWWVSPRTVSTVAQLEVQPMITVALSQGRELTHKAPDAALAPLVGEMELLNRDFHSAMSLVVAAVP